MSQMCLMLPNLDRSLFVPAALSECCTSLGEQRTSLQGLLGHCGTGTAASVFVVLGICAVLFAHLFPNGKPAVETAPTFLIFFLTDWSTNHLSHLGDLEVKRIGERVE